MRARVLQVAAAMLLGLLIGGAVVSSLMGIEIDRLHLANEALQEQLYSTENELVQVKESVAAHQRRAVTGIQPRISFAEEKNQLTSYEQSSAQLMLEKKVKEWLDVLRGQEIEGINYELVPKIVDNREVQINGHKCVLEVKLVVIKEKVEVFLEARVLPEQINE